jgi:hypothetical protein
MTLIAQLKDVVAQRLKFMANVWPDALLLTKAKLKQPKEEPIMSALASRIP